MSSINVSDSTPSSLCNSKESKHSKQTLEFFEKKNKAEADYEKYLIEILSSADSLGQVKQILSDKGELSEDMREALDRAINQEEKEQKKASEVPIQLIIKKIQIIKNLERMSELQKSLKENKPHFKKTRRFMSDEPIPLSEREETDFYLDLGLDLLTEYLWINKKLSPFLYTGEDRAIFELAKFWPDHVPGFQDPEKLILLAQEIRKNNQELYMDESDSDEETYEDSLINVSGISINVSDSTPSSLRDSEETKYAKRTSEFFEKKSKAEADYVKYLMALLSSADSLGQVKQILSDKGELLKDMREALDRAINQEEKEQKKTSEVPIQLIIKKIQLIKNRKRMSELQKLYKKTRAEFEKYEHRIFDSTLEPTQYKVEEALVLLDLESDLLAEISWIHENMDPYSRTCEDKEILGLAQSWPDFFPNFKDTIKSCRLSQMERKISQESDTDEWDSDEEAYEDSLIAVSGISLE